VDILPIDFGESGLFHNLGINFTELATLSTNYRISRTFAGGPVMSLQEWIALVIAAGTLAALVGAFWLMSSPNDRKR
jgi:hypothetical protein